MTVAPLSLEMTVASLEVDKPFSDERRKRHDTTSRHTGLHGGTGRRVCQCSYCHGLLGNESTLERSEKAITRSHAYLDESNEYGTPSTSTLAAPFKLTAFELAGLDSSHSLDRDCAWEAVPSALAAHSVGVPSMRKLKDGRLETCYHLQPAALLLPDPAVAAAEEQLITCIYEIKRHQPKLWARVPTEPPESVTKPALKATLHCAGCRVPQTATVRCNQPSAFWDVARAGGEPLTLDLGSSCLISTISTQGRHPATRRYPRVERDYDTKQWRVEDSEYLRAHTPHTQYKGPWYTVRASPAEKDGFSGCAGHEPAWVRRYELLWRADGGRAWHSLGVFAGNADETTEVAHAFSTLKGAGSTRAGGGLCARYLRFKPLDCEGGGAMRVGVYGERIGEVRSDARRVGRSSPRCLGRAFTRDPLSCVGGGVEGHTVTHAVTDAEGAGLVQYKLTLPLATPRHLVRDGAGLGTSRSMRRGYGESSASSNRKKLRRATARAAADLAHDVARLRSSEGWSYGYESDGTHQDPYIHDARGQVAAIKVLELEAGLTPAEREELELTLAISASLADVDAGAGMTLEHAHEVDLDVGEQMADAESESRTEEWRSETSEEWCAASVEDDEEWHEAEVE